jgi:hypothetical protein
MPADRALLCRCRVPVYVRIFYALFRQRDEISTSFLWLHECVLGKADKLNHELKHDKRYEAAFCKAASSLIT